MLAFVNWAARPIMPTPSFRTRFVFRLRLSLVSSVARLWNMLGGSPQTLARHRRLGKDLLVGQVKGIGRGTNPIELTDRPLNITFLTMLGSHSYMTATDVALARALRARGHAVRLVLCDQTLPMCENKPVAAVGSWDDHCYRCSSFGRSLFDAAGLGYELVGELTRRPLSASDATLLNSLDFSYDIESSLYKCFRVGKLAGTEDERSIRGMIAKSCATVARTALAVADAGVDRVVMSHGVYSTWAPALRAFKAKDIPVAVYNKGKRRNTTVIMWADGPTGLDLTKEWQNVKDLPLTPDERARIFSYLGTRTTHTADAMRYNFGEVESADATWRRLGLSPAKPTFVLFTNVLWDAASAQKQIAFPNAVDWVLETIDWFRKHPDRQLVVKIHPAEVVIGTNQPFAREIRTCFPELPENIRVIEPHEKVNSWSVGRVATAGLVHTSTPGLELPLEGIPCIVVSRAHYRGKGFTLDVETKDDYFRLIETLDPAGIDTEKMREYALRYAYLLFERCQLPWDFLTEASNGNYTAFNFESDQELLRHPTIALVVRCLETRSDFIVPRGDLTGGAATGSTLSRGPSLTDNSL